MDLLTRRSFMLAAAGVGVFAPRIVGRRAGSELFGPNAKSTGRTPTETIFNVGDFGARGNGASDDREAIQNAIDQLAGRGGGTLLIPAGTWLLSRARDRSLAIDLRSNVRLIGAGLGTVVKLMDRTSGDTGCHVLNLDDVEHVGISNLVIDGNREKQASSGHGIRAGGIHDFLATNLVIRNAYGYGMGFQSGAIDNVTIDSVIIHDTGADGIDFKNKENRNESIRLNNVTVKRWGLRRELEAQAAIDCRGRIEATNVRISEPGMESCVGVRMRHGELRSPNGLGGHGCRLTDFAIAMAKGRAQIGVDVVARDVFVGGGTINEGGRGVVVHDSGCRCTYVRVEGCADTGFLINAGGSGLDADGALLTDCQAIHCGEHGFEIEASGAQLVRCRAQGNKGRGLVVRRSASGAKIIGGDFSGNAGTMVLER